MPSGIYERPSEESRFWNRVNKGGSVHPIHGRCWEWTASTRSGYGTFSVNGLLVLTHRFSWELHKNRIPNGICVLHHCDNKLCVNPDHLFLGTYQDNATDKVNKGRQSLVGCSNSPPKGEINGRAKLTEVEVLEIRELYKTRKYSQSILGEMFGVSRSNINFIIHRIRWNHI